DGHLLVMPNTPNAPPGISLWSATANGVERRLRLPFLGGYAIIALSADGKTLATGREGRLLLWDIGQDAKLHWLEGPGYDPITALAFSPNGDLLACGTEGRAIHVWDRTSGKLHRTIDVTSWQEGRAVSSLAFHPDGRRVVAANRMGIYLWDVPSGKQIW